MITAVIINLTVEGLHCWPSCDIEEVAFLKYPHRHVFHICCKKDVAHPDRDIEIIQFKRSVAEYLAGKYGSPCCNFGAMSCEMIAKELIQSFQLSYCSVLEDGENGAELCNN